MNDTLKRIACYSIEKVNDTYFAAGIVSNAVFEIDVSRGGSKLVKPGANNLMYKENYWAKSARIGSVILFGPYSGNCIGLLDVENNKMSLIEVDNRAKSSYARFWEIAVWHDDFYVMGHAYPEILKINRTTHKVTVITKWRNTFMRLVGKKQDDIYYFADGNITFENHIIFPTGIDSTLFALDSETDEFAFVKVKSSIKRIWSISADNTDIWMTDFDSSTGLVSIWNIRTDTAHEIRLPSEGLWYAPVFHGNYAYFFPVVNEAKMYRVNKTAVTADAPEISVFEDLDVLFRDASGDEDRRIANTMSIKQEGDTVIFIRRPDYTWFTYNFVTGKLTDTIVETTDEEYIKKLNREYYRKFYRNASADGRVVNEREMSLEDYISIII